ncbi:MAG: metal ABC transporter permease [candidate division Zixibacteria bacterium]|nr:metal ABC transporter permease [candidate division Zixibacteria bacterium]
MLEFFEALGSFRFLQYALITGLLASIACGVVGSYVVTRRISYVAGAIAHFILGGMGAAKYLNIVHGWTWLEPLHGAIISAFAAALIIGLVSIKGKQREDTIIGALWAIGMAAGILFISQTPGYNEDLMSYLFGNILMVTTQDIWLIAALDVAVITIAILFYNQLLAVCFDEEFARLRGINVELYYLLLLILTAMTVVLLVTVVGIILVIALMTLPAAIAGHFTKSLGKMMILASGLSLLFTTSGLALSYGPNLPAGATIIIVAGVTYVVTMIFKGVKTRNRIVNK